MVRGPFPSARHLGPGLISRNEKHKLSKKMWLVDLSSPENPGDGFGPLLTVHLAWCIDFFTRKSGVGEDSLGQDL